MEIGVALLTQALGGDRPAMEAVIDALTPVIQARVTWTLLRQPRRRGRDLRQEVSDLTQEIFATLFEDEARTLRSWDPGRGLSLLRFVSLVSERRAINILTRARQNPWKEDPTDAPVLEATTQAVSSHEERIVSRQILRELHAQLMRELSPLGQQVFRLIWIEECSVEEVSLRLDMNKDAVYAWRSRLGRLARGLFDDLMSEDRAKPGIVPKGR